MIKTKTPLGSHNAFSMPRNNTNQDLPLWSL